MRVASPDGYCNANPCLEYDMTHVLTTATAYYGIDNRQIGSVAEYAKVLLYNTGFEVFEGHSRRRHGPSHQSVLRPLAV